MALIKLWPEGEAGVKLEMRTGKRIRCKPCDAAVHHVPIPLRQIFKDDYNKKNPTRGGVGFLHNVRVRRGVSSTAVVLGF